MVVRQSGEPSSSWVLLLPHWSDLACWGRWLCWGWGVRSLERGTTLEEILIPAQVCLHVAAMGGNPHAHGSMVQQGEERTSCPVSAWLAR